MSKEYEAIEKLYERIANGEKLSELELNLITDYQKRKYTEDLINLKIKYTKLNPPKDNLDTFVNIFGKMMGGK